MADQNLNPTAPAIETLPGAEAPAVEAAMPSSIPAGFVQIPGALYPTTAAQQAGFSDIRPVGNVGDAGSYLIGRKREATIDLPKGPVTIAPDGSAAPGGTPPATPASTPNLTDVQAAAQAGTSVDAITKMIDEFSARNQTIEKEILATAAPSERENIIQKQIDDLGTRLKQGLENIEGRPIPIEDIGGEQQRLVRNISILLDPLNAALTREVKQREGLGSRLGMALGFQKSTQELALKKAEMLQAPITEASKAVRDHVLDLARDYPDAGITMQDSAESAAKKVAEKSTKFKNENAAKEATTDDIREYQFAKTQGYTGTFLQFADRKRAGGGAGDFGPAVFPSGPTPTSTPEQTFEEFLAAEEEKAGQTFGPKKRDELRKQFEAKQTAEPAKVDVKAEREKWLSNPDVAPLVKSIIRGSQSVSQLTETEYRKYGTQIEQAQAAGVVPTATTAVQDAKFSKLTAKYDANTIVKQADKAAGLDAIADQVIANPKSSTNQLKALYSLVKQLDPDSAVREGELSLAQETLSTIDKYRMKIEKLKTGQILPADQAIAFANAIKELGAAWNSSLSRVNTRFSSEAKVGGIGEMWSDYTAGFEQPKQSSTQTASGKTSSGIGYKIIQ